VRSAESSFVLISVNSPVLVPFSHYFHSRELGDQYDLFKNRMRAIFKQIVIFFEQFGRERAIVIC